MKNYKLSLTSLIFSAIAITILIAINLRIARTYLAADGKTRGLFGLVEYFSFLYKYYFITLGYIAFALAISGIRKKEYEWWAYTALFMSVFSIFIKFWKLFI